MLLLESIKRENTDNMEGAMAITDRMKYGVKPSAVRSERYLNNIKASNGSNFKCTLGQDIIFDVPALGNGYYCDFSTSYIRFRVDMTLKTALTMVLLWIMLMVRGVMICTVSLNFSPTTRPTDQGLVCIVVKG